MWPELRSKLVTRSVLLGASSTTIQWKFGTLRKAPPFPEKKQRKNKIRNKMLPELRSKLVTSSVLLGESSTTIQWNFGTLRKVWYKRVSSAFCTGRPYVGVTEKKTRICGGYSYCPYFFIIFYLPLLHNFLIIYFSGLQLKFWNLIR